MTNTCLYLIHVQQSCTALLETKIGILMTNIFPSFLKLWHLFNSVEVYTYIYSVLLIECPLESSSIHHDRPEACGKNLYTGKLVS